MKRSNCITFLEHNLDLLKVKCHLPNYVLAGELLTLLEDFGMVPPDYVEKNAYTTTKGWEDENVATTGP